MSDQDNMFKETDDNGKKEDTNANPFIDKLKTIVGSDGEPKYKDIDTAIEALGHSQRFIDQLKAEAAASKARQEELESELSKREAVEDVVKRITNQNSNTPAKKEDQPSSGMSEEKIAMLIRQTLTNDSQQKTAQTNLDMVQAKLKEKFGDGAASVIKERAKELGTTPQLLQKLSEENPAMVLTLFDSVKTSHTPPSKPTNNSPQGKPTPSQDVKLTKSIMRGGATNDEITDVWNAIKAQTHKNLGIE